MSGLTNGDSVFRCLECALAVMNDAVIMTVEDGPSVAIEHIADYLNTTDAVNAEKTDRIPADWLSRWQVTRR